jgi:uncharacterized protein (DUF1684 family)
MSDASPPHSLHTADATLAWERWRESRLRALKAPDGWLTLVGLTFLEPGEWTIGADPTCRVCLPSASRPHLGTMRVTSDGVQFTQASDAQALKPPITIEGAEADASTPGSITLRADDAGGPSIIRDGDLSITLIRRNGQLALRMRDNRSPRRHGLLSIPTFPYNPQLVRSGIARSPGSDATIAITNITGFVETQPVTAILDFTLPATNASSDDAERRRSLVATAGANGSLFVVFADATNRNGTYAGGRFLTIDPPDAAGRVTLDFNRAINPVCALVPFATCPTPPVANRLRDAIEAGERSPPHA